MSGLLGKRKNNGLGITHKKKMEGNGCIDGIHK